MSRSRIVLLASLALCAPAFAQAGGVGDRIAAIFAADGIAVAPGVSRPAASGEEFRAVGIAVSGHLRADGWFRSPHEVVVGPLKVEGDVISLPTLSFPVRLTDIAFQRGRIEGIELAEGGLLDQSFDRMSFGPVSLTKSDGVFVSIDAMTVAPADDACFAVDMKGLAVSVSKTLPELARVGQDFYKGDARLTVTCAGDDWTISSLVMEAPEWGKFTVSGAISFDPQEVLDAVVSGRSELDPLFATNAGATAIVAGEVAFYTDIAALLSLGDLEFVFEDAGFAAAVREAMPAVAAAPGGVEVLTPLLLKRAFPSDISDRISQATASFLRGGDTLFVSFDAPEGASIADLATGKISPDAWSAGSIGN